MSLSSDVVFDIAAASVCAALILGRCGYRLLSRCKSHASCHRTWHADDAYMASALIPLIGRSTCITLSFVLNPAQARGPVTNSDADLRHLTVAQLEEYYITSYKLLIASRICYALFLWALKLCLLSFYSRFVHVLRWGDGATRALWWLIVLSFFIVLIVTLAECRPLYLMWDLKKYQCQRAMGNLISMGVFNIVTDVALIIFPFPILRYIKIDSKARIPLICLFCLGGFVVGITILRLPLILSQSLSQKSRSLWASIEILCACIVANTAFYYAFLKEIQRGHDARAATSSNVGQMNFYLPSTPSISEHAGAWENHEFDDVTTNGSTPAHTRVVR